MSKSATGQESIIMEEEIDPNYVPTEDEVIEYAKWLGMDIEKDKDLFWIAREGLMAPLPKDWKPCKTEDTEDIYYFNFKTGDSTWDHPCDGHYKAMYEENKKKKELQLKEKGDNRKSKAKQDVAELIGTKKKGEKKELSTLGGLGPLGGSGGDKLNSIPAIGATKALGAIGSGSGKSGNPLDKDVLGGGLKPLGASSGVPLGAGKPLGSIAGGPKQGGAEPFSSGNSSNRDRDNDSSNKDGRSSAVSNSNNSVASTGSKSKVSKLKSMIGDSGEFSLSPNPNSRSDKEKERDSKKERKAREKSERALTREKERALRGNAWGDSPVKSEEEESPPPKTKNSSNNINKDSPPPKAKKPTHLSSPAQQQTPNNKNSKRRSSSSDKDSDDDSDVSSRGGGKRVVNRKGSRSQSSSSSDDDEEEGKRGDDRNRNNHKNKSKGGGDGRKSKGAFDLDTSIDSVGDVQAFDIADDNSVTSYGDHHGGSGGQNSKAGAGSRRDNDRDDRGKSSMKKGGVDIYSTVGKKKNRYQSDSENDGSISSHNSSDDDKRSKKKNSKSGSRKNSHSSNSSHSSDDKRRDKHDKKQNNNSNNKNRFSVDRDNSDRDDSKENDWDTSSSDDDDHGGRGGSKMKAVKSQSKSKPLIPAGEGFDSDSSPDKDRFSNKNKNKTSRVNEYGEDLGSSSQDIDGIRHTLQLRTQELEQSENEVSKLKSEVSSLEKKVHEQDKDLESYKQQILDYNKEQHQKDVSKASRDSNFAELEQNYKKELKLKSELLHQGELAKREVADLTSRKNALEERVAKLSAELEQTNADFKSTKVKFDEQTLEINALKSNVDSLTTSKSQATQINELLTNEITQLRARLEAKEASSASGSSASANINATPTKAKKPVLSLTPTSAATSTTATVLAELEEKHESLQQKYAALNSQYMQSINDSTAKIQELNDKIHSQSDTISLYSCQLETLQKDGEAVKGTLNEENADLKCQLATLTEANRSLQTSAVAAAASAAAGSSVPMDDQTTALRVQLQEANNSRNELQRQYDTLKDSSDATLKKYTDLNKTYQQTIDQYTTDAEAHRAELGKKTAQIDALETTNRTVTTAIAEMESERNGVMKQLSQKELELKRAREELNRGATVQATTQSEGNTKVKALEAEVAQVHAALKESQGEAERLRENVQTLKKGAAQAQAQVAGASSDEAMANAAAASLVVAKQELVEQKNRYLQLEGTYGNVVTANESLSSELDRLQTKYNELLLSSSAQAAAAAAGDGAGTGSAASTAVSASMEHITSLHENAIKTLEQAHTIKLNRVKTEVESLHQQLREAHEQVAEGSRSSLTLQAEVDECQALISNLQQQLLKVRQQVSDGAAQLATTQSKNTKLMGEMNSYISRISDCQQEISELTLSNKQLAEENETLLESTRDLREKLMSRDVGAAAATTDAENRRTIHRLTLTNETNAHQLETYARDIERLQTELADARAQVVTATAQMNTLTLNHKEDHEERLALSRKIEELSHAALLNSNNSIGSNSNSTAAAINNNIDHNHNQQQAAAADAMLNKLQQAIETMTSNHKKALEEALLMRQQPQPSQPYQTNQTSSSSGAASTGGDHGHGRGQHSASPQTPISPYTLTSSSSSSSSPSPNTSPDSDSDIAAGGSSSASSGSSLLHTPGGPVAASRAHTEGIALGRNSSDMNRSQLNASILPSSLLDYATVMQVIKHYKLELQQFKYNLQQDKRSVKTRQHKLEKQRTQWKNSKRDLQQVEQQLATLQQQQQQHGSGSGSGSGDHHRHHYKKECARLQADISKRKKSLKASSIVLNEEAQVLNTCIDQVRQVKGAITDREYKVDKFERLGLRLKSQQQKVSGHKKTSSNTGMTSYCLDDTSLMEQRALHTLMNELDEPSMLLHNSPTPMKKNISGTGSRYQQQQGDILRGGVNPFQSAVNNMHADDAHTNNVTDLFFTFDEVDDNNNNNNNANINANVAGAGIGSKYPLPQQYPPQPQQMYPQQHPQQMPLQQQQFQYFQPQYQPSLMQPCPLQQPYPTQQQQQQQQQPIFYSQQPLSTQAHARSQPIPNSILRDRTNLNTAANTAPSSSGPSINTGINNRDMQQIYAQYKTQGQQDLYSQNINQTHSQLQLSQMLHQRSQSNKECDEHTNWLYGLQKQVGSFSHRNTGGLTDTQRLALAMASRGKPKSGNIAATRTNSDSGIAAVGLTKHVQYEQNVGVPSSPVAGGIDNTGGVNENLQH